MELVIKKPYAVCCVEWRQWILDLSLLLFRYRSQHILGYAVCAVIPMETAMGRRNQLDTERGFSPSWVSLSRSSCKWTSRWNGTNRGLSSLCRHNLALDLVGLIQFHVSILHCCQPLLTCVCRHLPQAQPRC